MKNNSSDTFVNIKFLKIRDKDVLLTYLQIILSKEDELYEVNKFTFK